MFIIGEISYDNYDDEDGDHDYYVKEDTRAFGRENIGPIASPTYCHISSTADAAIPTLDTVSE